MTKTDSTETERFNLCITNHDHYLSYNYLSALIAYTEKISVPGKTRPRICHYSTTNMRQYLCHLTQHIPFSFFFNPFFVRYPSWFSFNRILNSSDHLDVGWRKKIFSFFSIFPSVGCNEKLQSGSCKETRTHWVDPLTSLQQFQDWISSQESPIWSTVFSKNLFTTNWLKIHRKLGALTSMGPIRQSC